MKFVTIAVLATAAVATAEKCPLADMLAYAKSPVVQSCEKASGASLTAVAASGKFPDDSVMKIVCANTDCQSAIGGLTKFVPCELLSGAPLGGLLDTFKTKCAAIGGGAAPAPAPGVPAPTSAAPAANPIGAAPGANPITPGAPTPAPAATTPAPTTRAPVTTTAAPTFAPNNETSGSDSFDGSFSSGLGSGSNAGTPKQSQTIPSKNVPAPKKSSSSVVATASGVVFAAVIAALF